MSPTILVMVGVMTKTTMRAAVSMEVTVDEILADYCLECLCYEDL